MENTERYQLHGKLKKQGIKVKARQKIVFVPPNEPGLKVKNDLNALKKSGYCLQTTLF